MKLFGTTTSPFVRRVRVVAQPGKAAQSQALAVRSLLAARITAQNLQAGMPQVLAPAEATTGVGVEAATMVVEAALLTPDPALAVVAITTHLW